MAIEPKKRSYEERLYDLVRKYTVADIQRTLDLKLAAAGVLLMPTFAGMICLGHILYGFELEDRSAFVKFARHRMGFDTGFSEILYDNIYNGLKTQWCSVTSVLLVVRRDSMFGRDDLYFQDPQNEKDLIVNAYRIALAYIAAVEKLPEYDKTKKYIMPDRIGPLQIYRDQVAQFLSDLREVR